MGIRSIFRALLRLVLFLGLGFAAGLLFGLLTEEPDLLAGYLRGETESYALSDPDSSATARATSPSPSGRPSGSPSPAEGFCAEGAPQTGSLSADRSAANRPSESGTPLATARRQEAARAEEAQGISRAKPGSLPDVAAAPRRRPPPLPDIEYEPAAEPPLSESTELIEPVREVAGNPWSIQVGAFAERDAAESLVRELSDKAYPAELVVGSGGRSRWRVRVQPVFGRSEASAMADRLKRDEGLPTWLIPFESYR